MSSNTPINLGFKMPAEWHPHEATWLVWPKNLLTWPDGRLVHARQAFEAVIRALLSHEQVKLLVDDETLKDELGRRFADFSGSDNLKLIVKPTVDSWIRDFGPTFLINDKNEKAWCKWIFNAWGEKYDDLMSDTAVFASKELVPSLCFDAGFVLEGGSIEVNGKGVCLTTEQCLLNKNRNPHFTKEQIEERLKNYLGVTHIIWLKDGVAGDDTDGHIDDIARFVSEDTIVIARADDDDSENAAALRENRIILESSKQPNGKPWNIVDLPMPKPIIAEGEILPASYANFYIANEVVLLPFFDDSADEDARRILSELFPTRKIVPIPCREVVYGMGTIHCLSQQEPKV